MYMRGLNNNILVASSPHKIGCNSSYVIYLVASPPKDHVDPKEFEYILNILRIVCYSKAYSIHPDIFNNYLTS